MRFSSWRLPFVSHSCSLCRMCISCRTPVSLSQWTLGIYRCSPLGFGPYSTGICLWPGPKGTPTGKVAGLFQRRVSYCNVSGVNCLVGGLQGRPLQPERVCIAICYVLRNTLDHTQVKAHCCGLMQPAVECRAIMKRCLYLMRAIKRFFEGCLE